MIARLLLAAVLLAVTSAGLPVRAAGTSGIVEVVSPGGIKAWLKQDPSVPLMAVDFRFSGGATLLPPEKAGAASLAAGMLSEGAGDRDAEAMRTVLADHSISLGFSAGRDAFYGELTVLIEHKGLAAELIGDMLTAPRFDPAALERRRAGMIRSARVREKRPNAIAYRRWREIAYAGHPYAVGTQGTVETISGLGVEDLRAFLARALTRRSLIIGVAGDIDPQQLGLWLDDAFGALPDADAPPPPPLFEDPPGGVDVTEFPGGQSVVVFGHRAPGRNDPDWPAAAVAAQILGGSSFTSRLGQEVREKRGLAYGIGARLSPAPAGSILFGRTATRDDAVAETIRVIRQEWRRLAEEGPTADEVADAKAYMIGSFPISLDSSGAIASVLVQMQYYDLGIDYWERRTGILDSVTLADVQRVASEVLKEDALLFTVVGQPQGVETMNLQ